MHFPPLSSHWLRLVLLVALETAAITMQYVHQHSINTPESFFSFWKFTEGSAYTKSYAQFISQSTAERLSLVQNISSSMTLSTDSISIEPASSPGRKSIRIRSRMRFDESLFVLDLHQIPFGCGVRASISLLSSSKRRGFEAIEVVMAKNNASHATAMVVSSQSKCLTNKSVEAAPRSSGPQFAVDGGGVFVVEYDVKGNERVAVWFFNRRSIPRTITSRSSNVNTSTLGAPFATFSLTKDCVIPSSIARSDESSSDDSGEDVNARFLELKTGFCDAGGSTPISVECPLTQSGNTMACVDFIRSRPGQFVEAKWVVSSLDVFGRVNEERGEYVEMALNKRALILVSILGVVFMGLLVCPILCSRVLFDKRMKVKGLGGYIAVNGLKGGVTVSKDGGKEGGKKKTKKVHVRDDTPSADEDDSVSVELVDLNHRGSVVL